MLADRGSSLFSLPLPSGSVRIRTIKNSSTYDDCFLFLKPRLTRLYSCSSEQRSRFFELVHIYAIYWQFYLLTLRYSVWLFFRSHSVCRTVLSCRHWSLRVRLLH